ncbi:MAG: GNAT family N-acetyltransferase [Acidimicrobiia bacterium]|nr:GNAT family N-acetyltransferase [Acidimicrobiia bacterium]
MDIDGFQVEPLTPARFDDFVTVLGSSGQSGCWCMYWIAGSSKEWSEGAAGGASARNREAFSGIVDEGPSPGLIAYDDGKPIGWCRVMARTQMPGLSNSRHFRTDLDIDGVWSLSCFVVRSSHRGQGLTSVLAKAAAVIAKEQGAGYLEVYPTDTTDTTPPSSIYTGKASTFERLGYEVVQRLAAHKPMMRLEL